ncbi:MAG: peptide deformylase [Methylobacterium sp.]|nr:peptide deformylase [Methylobacterium sp.]MBX9932657.1 peptide deformylase [Methylobacterium sp.]
MPVFDLVIYPDSRLAQAAAPVMIFDKGLEERAAGLLGALQKAAAIGLAGPHVGLSERLVVLQMEPGVAPRTYVNPVITEMSEERAIHEEGSVSMPGIRDDVERPARIRLTYRDLHGREHSEAAEGFEAACLQHEIDQLDGIFWIERLSRLRRERARRRFVKLRRHE